MTTDRCRAPRGLRGRIAWLLACLGAGAAIGAIGHAVTGDAAWFLALPVALAVGWWFVADPERCAPRDSGGAGSRRQR